MASSISDRELALFEQIHREVAPVTLSNDDFDEFGYNIVQYSEISSTRTTCKVGDRISPRLSYIGPLKCAESTLSEAQSARS